MRLTIVLTAFFLFLRQVPEMSKDMTSQRTRGRLLQPQHRNEHASDHFKRGGQLCGIVKYEKSSPLAFFNECFHYSSISGYTLLPSQGSHYLDQKSSFDRLT